MKNAVVTLCFGKEFERMSIYTHPTIKRYADSIESDFIVINYPVVNAKDVGFEKCQIGNLLAYYDRIIYLDSDIIVTKKCPNLFDIVPENDLGAFIESKYWMYSPEVDHRKRIMTCQEKLGNIGWNCDYFNSGVMVLSKKHACMFEIPKNYIIDLRDQTQLNYNCKAMGFWVYDIGIRFNKMDFINPFDKYESYIIHYAGRGYTPEFHNMDLKIDVIKNDLSILEKI